MAYTPINWQTGDTITADKLNKMDNVWAVESSSQQLFTETVTTELNPEYPDDPAWGELAYSTLISADTLTVTFDGTDYVCEKFAMLDDSAYGGWGEDGPDFTNYPFAIISEVSGNNICTPTGGTHTVTVAGTSSSIETSPAFETAVNSVVDTSAMPMECVSDVTTWADMARAYDAGRILFFKPYASIKNTCFVTSFTDSNAAFIPALSGVTATFENDLFHLSFS